MRLRRIDECEELGHGARIQLIAALGPPSTCMQVLVGPARRDVGEDPMVCVLFTVLLF